MSNDTDDDRPTEHLDELPDGAGCTEIWEHIAERRTAGDSADD
ncbi:hypothetical protein [Halovivax cerinus]|uniref:Uncharacterized protein n=1 Tax=Halovivax cerinus TaxID=1487865 RepID=A0ABD5NQT4_9EURY|nr:hypothetical protein [Halovivax cerinus]